jgi:hypothetical protein
MRDPPCCRTRGAFALAVLLVAPISARSEDCQALLDSFGTTNFSYNTVTVVTLNNKGVASYIASTVHYVPGIALEGNRRTPNRFATLTVPGEYGLDLPKTDFAKEVQLFSNRCPDGRLIDGPLRSPGGGPPCQPFAVNSADDLAIEMTDAPTVEVTITLRSWNNGKVTFVPRCEDGFLIGATPDVKYIIHLQSP